jgi:hypothetical protein
MSVGQLTQNGVRTAVEDVDGDPRPFTAQIVSIKRFFSDYTVDFALQDIPYRRKSLFDIVLSDGSRQSKFLLSPALNDLVHQGQLKPKQIVAVQKYSRRFDEHKHNSAAALVIMALEIQPHYCEAILRRKPSQPLKWCIADDEESRLKPSLGSREGYIHNISDDFLSEDPRFKTAPFRSHFSCLFRYKYRTSQLSCHSSSRVHTYRWQRSEDIILGSQSDAPLPELLPQRVTLAFLSTIFKPRMELPPIAGRVVSKTAPFFFPSQDKLDPEPCNAYLVIDDGTESVPVVLWYAACRNLYTSIEVGDIILLHNYKAKPLSPFCEPYCPGASLELSVNSRNPTTTVFVLAPSIIAFPSPPVVWSSIRDIQHPQSFVDPEVLCNVVAVIVHAGRCELRIKKSGTAAESRFLYRWLQLRDDTSGRLLHSKVYTCGQLDVLTALQPGVIFSCTNMRVTKLICSSRIPPLSFVRTTRASLLRHAPVGDLAPAAVGASTRAHAVAAWAHAMPDLVLLRGGLVPFPPPSHRAMPIDLPLSSFDDALHVLAALALLQREQVAVQAVVVRVGLRKPLQAVAWRSIADARSHKRRRGATTFKVACGQGLILGPVKPAAPPLPTPSDSAAAAAAEEAPKARGVAAAKHGRAARFPASQASQASSAASLSAPAPAPSGVAAAAQAAALSPAAGGAGAGEGLIVATVLDAAVPEVVGPDMDTSEGSWFAVLRSLNGALMEVVLPGPSDALPPALAASGEGNLTAQMVQACTTIAGKRVVAVLDVFRAESGVEISVNRWHTASTGSDDEDDDE